MIWATAYGDGIFDGTYNGQTLSLYVDSGQLAVIPVELCETLYVGVLDLTANVIDLPAFVLTVDGKGSARGNVGGLYIPGR